MDRFKVVSPYEPTGDQPQAIDKIAASILEGNKKQTILGVTGSGKTFTMAKIIEKVNKPTLVLAHNKTLAGQLYNEFKEFFPENQVGFFVSYYDYYQPESYIPGQDLYIEKDSSINDDIDKMRHIATSALATRRDVVIVSSVSCIYGLGRPEDYENLVIHIDRGQELDRDEVIRRLVEIQYTRNDYDFKRSTFRVRGSNLEIYPSSYDDTAVRVEFFGDEVDRIVEFDPLNGDTKRKINYIDIFPASHYVTRQENLKRALSTISEELSDQLEYFNSEKKLIEAQRLAQRTNFDMEMLNEMGYCKGIENYSRHFNGTQPGDPPFTLLDYFPDDFLMFIDESHVTLPQVHAMYAGDRSRKQNLVDYGFRLPSAFDNRPLKFEEFEERLNQVVYVSATPGEYEISGSSVVAQQIIRPTGLLDPPIEVVPTKNQIDHLISQIKKETEKGGRVLITTLTKRMAEDLTKYLANNQVSVTYMHSDIDTVERMKTIKDLRMGVYDVLVGINLLREGLDIPEVSLIAILDADKEGFLRSTTSLIQTVGRAARNEEGRVIMYADTITDSMQRAIDETSRRRQIQEKYNKENGITPKGITKAINDNFEELVRSVDENISKKDTLKKSDFVKNADDVLTNLDSELKKAVSEMDFERAIVLRDRIANIKKQMEK